MKWTLSETKQETNHKFLNFFVFRYTVNKDGKESAYPYFVASRHDADKLLAVTGDFSRPDGVLMAVINKPESDDPEILLIKQFRPALNRYIVEFPAGLLDPEDEDECVAAGRECVEEAGVEIKNIRLLCPPSPTSTGLSDEIVSIVEAEVSRLIDRHLEMFEDINAEFVPFSKIPELLNEPSQIIAVNVRLCLLYLLEKNRK